MSVDDQILEELRKIREAVEPKPSPPPPKGLWAEFIDFIGKAGVLGLAIGFIMGTYIGKVVSALVQDPHHANSWSYDSRWGLEEGDCQPTRRSWNELRVGDFVGVIVDFLIVAGVIFLIAKYAGKMGLK